ncbi:MAG: putative transrane protein [Rhodocyclaceae bacterium]|nr:putative transrane protein [Rhodocyclaceae bacterium]
MTDDRFAYRIRQTLNYGLQDIPPATCRRLEAARHQALAHQKQTVPQWSLATAGHGAMHFSFPAPLKQVLTILALLLGMWIAFYWHSHQYISELEEVDSALLSDDLPPEAFLDQDFSQWLEDSSGE